MPFAALGLSSPLLQSIAERNYLTPTSIQREIIPTILRSCDVWASAPTGSGKTAAFALPILQLLTHAPRPRGRFVRALVLVPTRELAIQLSDSFVFYGKHLPEPLKILGLIGGVSINPQMMRLGRGADVIVATPGRLLDLLDHNALSLSEVSHFVLDEADRLLDLGFSEELTRIVSMLPRKRQSMLFSATFPPAVRILAESLLSSPLRIDVTEEIKEQPEIFQRAIEVDPSRRTQLLRHLIQFHQWKQVLVFVATKYSTEHVAQKLRSAGIVATALHGELSQGARTKALADFKTGSVQVLLATDVAARGIDIANLPAVINYDLPRSPNDYTHRIGRTARAGATGVAVNFISASTHAHFRLIEKRNSFLLDREHIEGFEPQELLVPTASTGGVKGHRKSKKDKLREAEAASLKKKAAK